MSLQRTPVGLLVKEWASATGAILRPPEAEGVSRETGLTDDYEVRNLIAVGLFNQWLAELTGFLTDAEKTGGILPWIGNVSDMDLDDYDATRGIDYDAGELVSGSDDLIYYCVASAGSLTQDPVKDSSNTNWELLTERVEPYVVGAPVLGSDGIIYRCRSAANSLTKDPVDDTNEATWERLVRTVPQATEVNAGTIRLATVVQSRAGKATNRAVTPEGLAEAITNRISTLSSDGVVDGGSLSGTTLTLTRSGSLAALTVDLSPLTTGLAPSKNPTFTGNVLAPEPMMNDNSMNAATTAFVRALANSLFGAKATDKAFGVAKIATADEISSAMRDDVLIDVAGLEGRVKSRVGPTGPQGNRGPTTIGQRGPDGPQGFTGPQGSKGAVGDVGENGNDGSQINLNNLRSGHGVGHFQGDGITLLAPVPAVNRSNLLWVSSAGDHRSVFFWRRGSTELFSFPVKNLSRSSQAPTTIQGKVRAYVSGSRVYANKVSYTETWIAYVGF